VDAKYEITAWNATPFNILLILPFCMFYMVPLPDHLFFPLILYNNL